jgi:hypothetical protein
MQRLWIPAALSLCSLVPAQRGAMSAAPPMATPPPLPGIPVMTTTDHPALMAQPLIGDHSSSAPSTSSTPAPAPRKETEAEKAAREFRESKRAGNELKRAVKSVRDLHWQTKLSDAYKAAAAEDKPVFWVNALGDLAGFT